MLRVVRLDEVVRELVCETVVIRDEGVVELASRNFGVVPG